MRLARLACIKRTVEDQNPAPPYYSVPRTDVNQVNLKVFAFVCLLKVIFVATFYPPQSKITRFLHGMVTTSLHLFYLGSAVFFFYQLQSNGEVAPQFSEKAPFSYFHHTLLTVQHPLGSQLATMIMFSFGPAHSLLVNFISILGDVTHGKCDITSCRRR